MKFTGTTAIRIRPWICSASVTDDIARLLLIPVLYYLLKPPSVTSIPTATPHFPLIGNAISFGLDPIKFLIAQRARHGDIVLVNLAVFRIVFLLGPDGNNTISKGTEKSGISFWAAVVDTFGPTTARGVSCFLKANR